MSALCPVSPVDLLARVDPTLRTLARQWAAQHGLDADDLFQDARVLIVAHAAQFDPAKNTPAGWARTLALGALRDGMRASVREESGRDGWACDQGGSVAGGLAEVLRAEDGDAVRRAVDRLPEMQAEAVRRVYGLGCRPESARSVAARWKCSAGVVSRQLAAAEATLRAALASCCF